MSEKLSNIFGSKSNRMRGGKFCDPVLPPPAMTRYSSTSSLRNSQYMSQPSTSESGDAAAGPRRISSSHGFPYWPPSQNMANRSPVAVQSPLVSSTSSSPTLTDGFFYALSELKHPIQAPRPIVVIPAFLVPETPVEPQKSHFSWSTNGTSQAPSTPSILTAQRVSVAESEQRCSWVGRSRGTVDIPSVSITTRLSQSSPSGALPIPAGSRQHPGGVESFDSGRTRTKSAEFDKKIHGSCGASRASTTFGPEYEGVHKHNIAA